MSFDRESAAAEVARGVLPDLHPGHRALVVGDVHGGVAADLRDMGAEVLRWDRWGTDGTPWPDAAGVDLATVRLPRDKGALDLAVHAALAALAPGGELLVYGPNDEGARSVGKRLRDLLRLETADTRRHCRAWLGARPEAVPGLRADLAAWRAVHPLELPSGPREWASYPGTFAKGGLDPATALLLGELPATLRGRVLDFAAGTGVISAEVQARAPEAELHLVDVDALALAAAADNVPGAALHLGDGWDAVPGGSWDLIVSNPPLHRGRERDLSVARALVEQAPRRLTGKGALWLVTQGQVPVERWVEGMRAERVRRTPRFQVWRVESGRPDRPALPEIVVPPGWL